MFVITMAHLSCLLVELPRLAGRATSMSSFGRQSIFKSFHPTPVTRRLARHPDGMPSAQHRERRTTSRETERWWLLDAKGLQAREVAKIAAFYVTAQHKPDFQPTIVASDQVVVINTKEIVMVGDTWTRYPIHWNSTYSGGKYRVRASEMFERDPNMLLWNFIREEIRFNQSWKNLVTDSGGQFRAQNMLEFVWLYEDAIHPHGDESPRPILWEADLKPMYYQNKFLQRRWQIGQYTR